MLQRLRATGLVWATLFTLAGCGLMVGLGVWQLQRKAWKDGLIAAVKARTTAEPVPLDVAARRFATDRDLEYLRVTARGTYLIDKERLLYAPHPELGPGYHVFTPFVPRSDVPPPRAGCGDYVLVNRGFVPEALKSPDKRPFNHDAQGDLVTGLLRLPEKPGTFTPANEPRNNLWFWRDLGGMAASLGLSATAACATGDGPRAFPFFVDAEPEDARVNPTGWPRGGVTNLDISNRHLEYVLTWFGLAVTLLAVFAAFAAGRLRQQEH